MFVFITGHNKALSRNQKYSKALAVGEPLFMFIAQPAVPSLIITSTLIGFLKLATSEEKKKERVVHCYDNVKVYTHHISRNNVTVNFSSFINQPIYYVIMNLTFEKSGRRRK